MLLDEPFTGLDDASASALVERLRRLRESGAIVMLATHDLDLAEGLLDQAVFLRDGRMVQAVARPERLRATYRVVMTGSTTGHDARVAWQIVRKDLTVEVRSREIAYTTLFFAVSCLLVFAFALVREGKAPGSGAAGILWIALTFAGTLALGRTFERERQAETLRALLLAPVPRAAVYLGKLVGIVALLAGAELVLVPLVALLFPAPLLRAPVLARRDPGDRHARLRRGGDAVRRDAGPRAQPRRAAAGAAVSGDRAGDHRRRARHVGAAAARVRRRHRAVLAGAAGVLRRRVRDAGALDVRARDDRTDRSSMPKWFMPAAALCGAMFASRRS